MTLKPANIRSLQHSDLSIAAALAKKASDHPWSERVFEDCLKAQYYAWVLVREEKIIGFLVVQNQIQDCELLNIAVDPDCQRQGYGQQLLTQAMAHAESKNLERIILDVRASNTAAISLYHAAGFIDVGIRKNYYPKGNDREDAVLMNLSLTASGTLH